MPIQFSTSAFRPLNAVPWSVWRRVLISVPLVASLALLCFHMFHLDAHQSELGYQLTEVDIKALPGQTVVVTGRELAAQAESTATVSFTAPTSDTDKFWRISSRQSGERVAVQKAEQRNWRELHSVPLAEGMLIDVAGQRFKVGVTKGGNALTLLDIAGRTWQFDGATLGRADGNATFCPGLGAGHWMVDRWNRYTPRLLNVDRGLFIGGTAACGNRIPINTTLPRLAYIRQQDGQFILGGVGDDGLRVTRFKASDDTEWTVLLAAKATLTVGDRLMTGKTGYWLREHRHLTGEGTNVLALEPHRRITKVAAEARSGHPQVTWRAASAPDPWRVSTGAWVGLAFGVLLAMVVFTSLTLWFRRRARLTFADRLRFAAVATGLGIAVVGFVFRSQGLSLGAGTVLALLTAAVVLTALFSWARDGWPVAWALVLLAIGVGVQAELGRSASHTAGLLQTQTLAALSTIAMGLGVAISVAVSYLHDAGNSWQRSDWLNKLLWALAGVALSLLLAQVLHGDELGVFGIQPVELVKLALVLMTAQALALRMRWTVSGYHTPAWKLWLTTLPPIVLLLSLVAVSLWLLQDFSPFVLLACWSAGVVLSYWFATGRGMFATVVAVFGLSAALWLMLNPDHVVTVMDWLDLYGDRIRVWATPELHPFTGDQLLRAQRLAERGLLQNSGTNGSIASGIFGHGRFGEPLGSLGVWRVPAIADDFAPTLVILLYGRLGVAVLWCLQIALVASLLTAAVRQLQMARSVHGNYFETSAHHLRYFTLWAGAFFMLAHTAISWGTNTGLTPVMGQPMAFISAAGSHLLLMVWPLVFLGVSEPQA